METKESLYTSIKVEIQNNPSKFPTVYRYMGSIENMLRYLDNNIDDIYALYLLRRDRFIGTNSTNV